VAVCRGRGNAAQDGKLVSQSEYNKIAAHVIARQPAVASK
jgi:hypothetical protein